MLAMYWLISTMATSSLFVYSLNASSILFTDVSARQHGLVFQTPWAAKRTAHEFAA